MPDDNSYLKVNTKSIHLDILISQNPIRAESIMVEKEKDIDSFIWQGPADWCMSSFALWEYPLDFDGWTSENGMPYESLRCTKAYTFLWVLTKAYTGIKPTVICAN